MSKRVHLSVDIESLGTPERSGYDIIIPNYAIVFVPTKPTVDISQFAYVKLPYQEQVKAGLKSDAGSMSFWMNTCSAEYPNAFKEVASTMQMESASIQTHNGTVRAIFNDKVMDLWKSMRYNDFGDERELSIWGNGCHFDCSILQANHLKLYGNGDLWKYDSPENARSVKRLLSVDETEKMNDIVEVQLEKFVMYAGQCGVTGLELHHPLYDAAREAIQISFCLDLKKS